MLVKYKMLEWQTARLDDLVDWGFNTPFLCAAMPGQGQDRAAGTAWLHTLLQELAHSQALALEAGVVRNL